MLEKKSPKNFRLIVGRDDFENDVDLSSETRD